MALEHHRGTADPALLDLPWRLPLDEWPEDTIAALPKGISRHLVRFVELSRRASSPSRRRGRDGPRASTTCCAPCSASTCPCVEPVAVITDRTDADGEPLDAVPVTRHLKFSLPYRALFSQTLRPDTATRLVDALAVLLVRLHIVGFFWGDVSLSNTLFRRDAGAFAAYLVDAETGELHERGSPTASASTTSRSRASTSPASCMDLEAGGRLEDGRRRRRDRRRHRRVVPRRSGRSSPAPSRSHRAERWRITERVRAPQRPRLRHRRALDQDRRRRHAGAHPAEGRRCRPPPAPPAAPHRTRRRGEPGAPPAQRPRRVPRARSTARATTRRWSRTSG